MDNKLNVLIISGSSFVAKSFILYHKNPYNIKSVSRSKTGFENEFVISDFSKIPDELFLGIDVVLNCAAIVHREKKIPESLYNQINYKLAVELGEKSKRNGVKTFIQLSTVAVYGNSEEINSGTPENPENFYGKSKLLADKKLLEIADDNFKVIIFRPPMIYGGINSPGNMQRLVNFVRMGFPLPFKNSTNKRDFINIRNLIGYIEAAIQSGKSNIYLINDNSPVSTYELVNIISKKLNKKTVQFSLPDFFLNFLRKIKPGIFDKLYGSLRVDAEKSRKVLNYTPDYSLEQGIEEMIQNRQ